MQYILSEKEYEELKGKVEQCEAQLKDTLIELCKEVANHKPIPWTGEKDRPWGCVIDKTGPGYCDYCPVEGLCPYDGKRFHR